ncbi:hypothetical protein L596_014694 [Steinernema carpocapsae]|uniref:CTCHY-type domain-containing protein n=1 Tax=Steinernema carpocapsae TaxID=34508 RepID=A0A4V6A2V5_STECR|nr:hypothetical protein L596_014694 [Steinernema carpocapsae]
MKSASRKRNFQGSREFAFRSKKPKDAKRAPGNADSSAIRQRGFFELLDSSDCASIPHCPHGPCLLFGERGGRRRRWFSCAVFRSANGCSFRVDIRADGRLPPIESPKPQEVDYRYDDCPNQFRKLKASKVDVVYCKTCESCVPVQKHAKDHVVSGPLEDLKHPSRILDPMCANKGQAQYWFSEESISVILDALNKNSVDGVICIGAPSIFEAVEKTKLRRFMLDVDHRFARFYSKSQFAHYSLLVNHFYEPDGATRMRDFLKGVKRVAIICDPPFGVFMNAITRSFEQLKAQVCDSMEVKSIIAVPIFVGKHLEREGFSMIEYKVTYTNHKQFSTPERTVVRLFTNFPANSFVLPFNEGYRFCKPCERYVCVGNKHCDSCGKCASKDGSTYAHCAQCGYCVKPTYEHCSKCRKCHLRGRCF